jgi:site-specific DNA recombinase
MPRKTRVAKRPARAETLVDGYARVSTDEQARAGASLANQVEKIRLFAELHELRLVKVIEDPGESAKSLERPGVQEALDDLARGRVDGLVVAKLDRLTRSLGDWVRLIESLFNDKAGRLLFSVGDSIDTRTPSGRLVLNMIITVAQWEREEIGYRTKSALQGKIGRGERCGRVRYGYELAEDGKTLRPLEHEQRVIELLAERRARGLTYQELVDELGRLGIETKTPGGLWHPSTVHQILHRSTP